MYLKAYEIAIELRLFDKGRLIVPIRPNASSGANINHSEPTQTEIMTALMMAQKKCELKWYTSTDNTAEMVNYISNVENRSDDIIRVTVRAIINVTAMVSGNVMEDRERDNEFVESIINQTNMKIMRMFATPENIPRDTVRYKSTMTSVCDTLMELSKRDRLNSLHFKDDPIFLAKEDAECVEWYGSAEPIYSKRWADVVNTTPFNTMPSDMINELKKLWKLKSAKRFVPYTVSYLLDDPAYRDVFIMAAASMLYDANRAISPIVYRILPNALVYRYDSICNILRMLDGCVIILDVGELRRSKWITKDDPNMSVITIERMKHLVMTHPSIVWMIVDDFAYSSDNLPYESFKDSYSITDITSSRYDPPEIRRFVATKCKLMNLSQYADKWSRQIIAQSKTVDMSEKTLAETIRISASCVMDDPSPDSDSKYKSTNGSIVFPWESSQNRRARTSSRDTTTTRTPKGSLDSLIGLVDIKKTMTKIIAHNKLLSTYHKNDMCMSNLSRHMIFTGNPGTAKTSMARAFYNELLKNRIVKPDRFVEVGRQDLVAKYVGQTAPLVEKAFSKAKGGVLFIDEAYSLSIESGGFGEEAISTIVQLMENYRDEVIVILAGYKKEMTEMVRINPGLRSRIAFTIDFPDYNPEELTKIALSIASTNNFKIDEKAQTYIKNQFTKNPLPTDLGNGRFARNLIERAILNHSNAIADKLHGISDDELRTLTPDDMSNGWNEVYNDAFASKRHSVGF